MADLLEAAAEIGRHNPAPGAAGSAVLAGAERDAAKASHTGDVIKARMPQMVKGAGYAIEGGNKPLSDAAEITQKAAMASYELRSETQRGYQGRADVVKSFNGGFLNQFGYLKTALSMPSLHEQLGQIFNQMPGGADAFKNFTAGNLGIGSVK